MNYHIIDLNTYPRRAHFEYFGAMDDPYVGVTVQADITAFHAQVKRRGLPFFLSFLYNASLAVNSVAELRQRLKSGVIVEYDFCRTSHTVALSDGTYCFCELSADKSFEEFLPEAIEKQRRAIELRSLVNVDGLDLVYVSCVTGLSYSSLTQPTPRPADSNPRLTWGRFYRQGDSVLMPVTLLVNHALVDGRHISEFFDALFALLEGFSS